MDFETVSGTFMAYGQGPTGPTLRHFNPDHDLHLGKDGSFEVVLSAQRPPDWKGDWWKLDAGATLMWVRQIAYDWVNEVDGRFAIERLDVPAVKPRQSAETIDKGMRQMVAFTGNWVDFALNFSEGLRKKSLINKMDAVEQTGQGGIKDQAYVLGLFDLEPNEALILETEVPKCDYWMFHLGNEWMASLDWLHHQVTLNGYSARLDRDGKFRAVISTQDPGIHNWLDAQGLTKGSMIGRWKGCDRYPQPPTITKVAFTDVQQYLPSDTARVSAADRDKSIRTMRKAAQLRRRW